MLGLANFYGGQLYIELKSAPARPVWDSVVAHDMQDRVFFWSFVTQTLKDMRAITPQARLMMRRQDFVSLDAMLNFLSPALVEYAVSDDWSEFPELRHRNVPIMIAYGGDDLSVLAEIADASPDYVNLDRPFEFAEICRRKGKLVER